jgi:Cu/Ag efflux pump CusA
VLRWLQRGYQRTLIKLVQAPRVAFAALAALLLVGGIALPFMQTAFIPSFKEPNLLVRLEGTPGTARTEMDRIVSRASQEIRSIPGVTSVGAHVGRAVLSDRRIAVNSSEIWVSVDPSASYDTTLAAIQATVDNYPGLNHSVETYLTDRTRSLGGTTGNAVTVRVFGENLSTLRAQADKVQAAVANVQGVSKAEVLLPIEEPTLEIKVDLEAAQKAGLKPGDIRRSAATLLSGIQAGSLFDAQKVFDVVVWGTPEIRTSIHGIRDLLLDNPDGNVARLGDVASVNIVPATTAIRHDGVRTYLDVRASVNDRPLSAVSTDINNRIHSLSFPLEYHAEVLGDNAAREATQNRLLGLVIAAVLGMFLLVQAAVGSWRLAAVACVAVPAALTGGVLAALATGGVLSLGAVLGLLMIFGLAARSVILLITRYHQLQREDGEAFGAQLILRGAGEHLSLVVTTACATGLALLPFVIFGDTPGLEVIRPMAIVVLGGLITSIFVTLFIIPTIYLRFGASPQQVATPAAVGALRYAGVAGAAD